MALNDRGFLPVRPKTAGWSPFTLLVSVGHDSRYGGVGGIVGGNGSNSGGGGGVGGIGGAFGGSGGFGGVLEYDIACSSDYGQLAIGGQAAL